MLHIFLSRSAGAKRLIQQTYSRRSAVYNDNSALTLECIAYFVVVDSISASLSAFVSVSFAVFSKFALLRSQIWKRGGLALFVRISAMQINGFTYIVTDVTSLAPNFLSCIALLIF